MAESKKTLVERLFAAHGGRLEAFFFRRVRSQPDAAELAQEVYVRMLRVPSLQTTPVKGLGSYDCAGYFGTLCGAVTPRWRHVLNATWSTPWSGVSVGLRWRYIGSSESAATNPSPFLSASRNLHLARIPAYNYFDLSGIVALGTHSTLRLGVNNTADKPPPLVADSDCLGSAGGLCNGNTFPGTYDAMGRYLFANVSAQW